MAVGAGFSVALACDIRIASERARFGTAFRNVGLSGDFGGSYLLPRIIGSGRAREMYFTAEIIMPIARSNLGSPTVSSPTTTCCRQGSNSARSLRQDRRQPTGG
ncbi:MAG: hypothetical protein IPL66_12905 [Dehalococcoidia bacterium]|nr:hypothetical protein [Dehalococcoidia bacterium]